MLETSHPVSDSQVMKFKPLYSAHTYLADLGVAMMEELDELQQSVSDSFHSQIKGQKIASYSPPPAARAWRLKKKKVEEE